MLLWNNISQPSVCKSVLLICGYFAETRCDSFKTILFLVCAELESLDGVKSKDVVYVAVWLDERLGQSIMVLWSIHRLAQLSCSEVCLVGLMPLTDTRRIVVSWSVSRGSCTSRRRKNSGASWFASLPPRLSFGSRFHFTWRKAMPCFRHLYDSESACQVKCSCVCSPA